MIRFMFREGFKSFFRAKFSNLITILSLIFSLLLVSVIATGSVLLEEYLFKFKRETPITIYFPSSVNKKEAGNIARKIKTFKFVKSVEYISKDDGIIKFDELYNTSIVDILGKNPLPNSAVVKFSKYDLSLKDFSDLKNKIKSLNKKIEVIYNSQTFVKLEKYIDILSKLSVGLTLFVLLVSVILVVNTIRLSIHDKRLIIRTMRLVGAKNRHIRSPFTFEAFLQAFIAFSVVMSVILYVENYLLTQYAFKLKFYPYQNIALGVLAFSVSILGARISIRKYLNWNFK